MITITPTTQNPITWSVEPDPIQYIASEFAVTIVLAIALQGRDRKAPPTPLDDDEADKAQQLANEQIVCRAIIADWAFGVAQTVYGDGIIDPTGTRLTMSANITGLATPIDTINWTLTSRRDPTSPQQWPKALPTLKLPAASLESGTYHPLKLKGIAPETIDPHTGEPATSFEFNLETEFPLSGRKKLTHTTESYQGPVPPGANYGTLYDADDYAIATATSWRITQKTGGASLTFWIPRLVTDIVTWFDFPDSGTYGDFPVLDQTHPFGGSPPDWDTNRLPIRPFGPERPL